MNYTNGEAKQFEVIRAAVLLHSGPTSAALADIQSNPLTCGRLWTLPMLAATVRSFAYQSWLDDWDTVVAATAPGGAGGPAKKARRSAPAPDEEPSSVGDLADLLDD